MKKDLYQHLEETLKIMPKQAGVYKYYDKDDQILYIGKAKSLQKRVRSYFRPLAKHNKRIFSMLKKIKRIDYIITQTETEALLLETNLIKTEQPRYNILMRDDKNFLYIKITIKEDFPRILLTRRVVNDGAKYFGPKTSAQEVKKSLKLVRILFPIRDCNLCIKQVNTKPLKIKTSGGGRKIPCLDFHIHTCLGPCITKISRKKYGELVKQVINFFSGDTKLLNKKLTEQMIKAGQNQNFEQAIKLKKQLETITNITQKQKITNLDHSVKSIDVVNFVTGQGKTYFNILLFRERKLIATENFILQGQGEDNEALRRFILQYYQMTTLQPKIIYLPQFTDLSSVQKALQKLPTLANIKLKTPQRGVKKALLQMAYQNAIAFYQRSLSSFLINDLQDRKNDFEQIKLQLTTLTKIKSQFWNMVECYDISHLGGTNTVASQILFTNGRAQKSAYRSYNIRSLENGEINDFAAIYEVISRSLRHHDLAISELLKNKKQVILGKNLTAIIAIDGGKGQLTQALQAQTDLIKKAKNKTLLQQIKIISIVKPQKNNKRKTDALMINPHTEITLTTENLYFIQRLRNEAHRFAITHNREQRAKKLISSPLLKIPGIGTKKRKDLITHFGSLTKIKSASITELNKIVGNKLAQTLKDFL